MVEIAKAEQNGLRKVIEYRQEDGRPKIINWNRILRDYGSDTRDKLQELISDAGLTEDDPATIVLAGLFISQLEQNVQFLKLKNHLDKSKSDLTNEFENNVYILKGVVADARKHLSEGNEAVLTKRHDEIKDLIRLGVARALNNYQSVAATRSGAMVVGAIACTFLVAILSVGAGALGMQMAFPRKEGISGVAALSPDNRALLEWANSEEGAIWLGIASQNQENIDTCIDNKEALKGKCAINIP